MSSYPYDPLIGLQLDGRYRVTGVLGRGGMGVVYEGVHVGLGRAVAIKVLGPDTATDEIVVERFLREARVASGLAHGNIVDVSDLGRLPDGRPYLVMPKVHGVDFATLIEREGRIQSVRVVSLLRGVAAALDLVHAKGLVHRDVKPENLMHVMRADGSETVMLMDFGIAALLGANATRLTGDGMRCGTPAYMAPESIASGAFDQRVDVYALATVAFEMLSGRVPFDDVLPMRVMDMKTHSTAPSLSAAAADAHFGHALERVVARGLARDPALRYPSAGEFLAALEHAVIAGAHEPSAADAHTLVLPAPVSGTAPALRGGASLSDAARSTANARAANARQDSALEAPASGETAAQLRRRVRARIVRFVLLFAALFAVAVLLLVWRRPLSPAPRSVAPRSVAPQPVRVRPSVAATLPGTVAPLPAAIDPRATASTPHASHRREPASASSSREAASREPAAQEPRAIAPDEATPAANAERAAQNAERLALEALKRDADSELLQGHLARAVELFERAIARDPEDVAAFRGLGLAQERLGHTAAAVRAYRSALALEPAGAQSAKLHERLQRLGSND